MNNSMRDISAHLQTVIRGKPEAVELLLIGLCGGGHVLIEDVPGVGKTTLAKALAAAVQAEYRRIQFTPDLLPTDITGGMVFTPGTGEFTFRPGPVFCQILLADEINRASPRTQSALLEAMNERQVSVEGRRFPLPSPFMVIATQNPVEFHGTYPLPEAQLDRFLLRFAIGYPGPRDELDILSMQQHRSAPEPVAPVMAADDVGRVQESVCAVGVEESVRRYIIELVQMTRREPRVRLGASPRAALALQRAAQARAFLHGRDAVLPDDVKSLAVPVLAHRLLLDSGTAFAGGQSEQVVKDLLHALPAPV